jgi:transcriptional regulator of acetoin/glycerol metabolism
MKKLIFNEVLYSHKRCLEMGLKQSLDTPLIFLEEEELRLKIRENNELIDVFRKNVNSIFKQLKERYVFLLTDTEGYLLEMVYEKKIYNNLDKSGFKIGTSFKEESCGTNAISLAMRLNQLVYLKPEQHYCNIFKEWYCIAIPLIIDDEIIGYLDLSTIKDNMVDEMVVIVELLAYKIVSDYIRMFGNKAKNSRVKLTEEQLKVLKLVTKGYKDIVIAKELGISINTVNYHKRNIFKKLDVRSTREAIAKAIRMGLIE